MIGKLRALLGVFSSIKTARPVEHNPERSLPHLPDHHPEELPVPRWEVGSHHGHVLLDQVQQAAGRSGRNTLYGLEVITRSGKRYTLDFTPTLPEIPLVVGWNVHFLAPEGNRMKVGQVTRIIRLEPDGGLYVNLLRPPPEAYLAALQGGTSEVLHYLRNLSWQPI